MPPPKAKTIPSFKPQNPPSKPLRVSIRNRIWRHLRASTPLPGTPLQHTLLKLRNRIRIPSVPLGDSPKRRPDLGRINRMTSAASLLASRDGPPSISNTTPRRRSKRTPAQNPSQRSNQNHPSHNVTPVKDKKPHRRKPPAGQSAQQTNMKNEETQPRLTAAATAWPEHLSPACPAAASITHTLHSP